MPKDTLKTLLSDLSIGAEHLDRLINLESYSQLNEFQEFIGDDIEWPEDSRPLANAIFSHHHLEVTDHLVQRLAIYQQLGALLPQLILLTEAKRKEVAKAHLTLELNLRGEWIRKLTDKLDQENPLSE